MLEDSFYWIKRGIGIALVLIIVVFVYRGLIKPGLEARQIHKDIVRMAQSSQDMTTREACRNLNEGLKTNFPFLFESGSNYDCQPRRADGKVALEVSYEKRIKLYDKIFVVSSYLLDSSQPFTNTYRRDTGS